jgi:hypothetical protein
MKHLTFVRKKIIEKLQILQNVTTQALSLIQLEIKHMKEIHEVRHIRKSKIKIIFLSYSLELRY